MAKSSKKSQSKAQKLEAFRLTQHVNEILRMGAIQNQAILDSAGEQRPAEESHVINLLEERLTKPIAASSKKASSSKKAKRKPKKAYRPKKQKRRAPKRRRR